MSSQSKAHVTRMLQAWQAGEAGADEELWPLVYDELRVIARSWLRRRPGQTLETTELVNEACLHLVGKPDLDWPHRSHFFAFAAKVMRHVLVDRERRRRAHKRDAELVEIEPSRIADPSDGLEIDVLAVDHALRQLAAISSRHEKLVELRFFAGLSVEQAAAALGISTATAVRDWRAARTWLYGKLGDRSDRESRS